MNCKKCGAPMKVEENQDFFHCEYCGCFEFPDPNLDEVALLDEVSSLVCPVCNKPLVSAVVKGVDIFSCPICRGTLISQSKMLPILRQVQLVDSAHEEFRFPQPQSEQERQILCPACQKKMAVYPYGGPGNVIIQGCSECCLIWLDFGELSKILHSYKQMYHHPSNELGAKRKSIDF
jgi:Zn-finger nucleic acid-binding protein